MARPGELGVSRALLYPEAMCSAEGGEHGSVGLLSGEQ